jgi:hypothetical protein
MSESKLPWILMLGSVALTGFLIPFSSLAVLPSMAPLGLGIGSAYVLG